jgi:hypothetical protein
MIRRTRAAAALLPIALLVAACGASTASGAPSGSAAATSAAQPSTPAASASAAGEASTPPIGAIPSFDVSTVLAGLSKVDSYKETITVDGAEVYAATVVTKPALARAITANGSKIVIIGDKAWMSQDGGTTYQSVPESMATGLLGAFDPSLMIGAFGSAAWSQAATDMGAEQKNGVNAHHYRIDSTSPNAALLALPAGATIDVWIADDDYLVAVETTGFAGNKNVQIEITNVDDPANKVDEPS